MEYHSIKAKLALGHMENLKLKIQNEKITKERDQYKRILEELIYKNVTINLK